MIIVAEGPSAIGKTTLLETLPAAQVVAEAGREMTPDGNSYPLSSIFDYPPSSTSRETPRFWVDRQMRRWQRLLEVERRYGCAYADTDPIKLHYGFGLALIGAAARDAFDEEFELTKAAMAMERLGFADHVVLLSAPSDVLAARKAADSTRRRGNFDLHARLGPSLETYYAALERLRPDTVRHVDAGDHTQPEVMRAALQGLGIQHQGRYDVDVLQQFKHELDGAFL